MADRARPSRTQLWLEGLGEWSWPGRAAAAADFLPPSWVPALPPRFGPAPAAAGARGAGHVQRGLPVQRLAVGVLLCALASVCAVAALGGPAAVERMLGANVPSSPLLARPGPEGAPPLEPAPLPELAPVDGGAAGSDLAGSAIEHASFPSASLNGEGSFFVYLPPGYATGVRRYPVLYLLHGRNGHADAFLEIGIQQHLDRLIARRAIPPMIAVMPQDLSGLDNWRDIGRRLSATYVVEVQELVDRMLRTIPARDGRAIAGSSMGGYGAMNIALANPQRFAVVESWLGFFNGLEGALEADRKVISRLGLQAFLYGAAADPVAVPSEDPEFAAELRAAGAQAQGAIYSGGHSLEKVEEHLDLGLLFAGRSLQAAERRASLEAARHRASAEGAAVRARVHSAM
jgi:hypothetical protein